MAWYERITGSITDKRRYWAYRERMKALPEGYREAGRALERYLMYAGNITKGDVAVRMLEGLADLLEQSVADATPVRAIVGADPVEFVEEFLANYDDASWITRERDLLRRSIDAAAG